MGLLKKLDWYKIGIFALFSVCGLLYAQQNSIIAAQGEAFRLCKVEIKTELNEKVDNTFDANLRY